MNTLSFTKMHGLGNDFIVVNAFEKPIDLPKSTIQKLADRSFGIGCDQLLMVEKPRGNEALFQYRIFNSDGSEVEQCGNGARCFAKFVHDKGLTTATEIPVETAGGLIVLKINEDESVTVDMGEPSFNPADLPFNTTQESDEYDLLVEGEVVKIAAVSVGNPHAVLKVDSTTTAPVAWLGPAIERHERFPQRVNVGFMKIENRNKIKLRVFERGAGETKACGTGACAAVAAGIKLGWLDSNVEVKLPGGKLNISWNGPGNNILMTGPATTVFEGKISI